AGDRAVAVEVDDRVAVGLAGAEQETVIAAVAGEQVVRALAVEIVGAGVADERVVVVAAGGVGIAGAVEDHRLDVGTDGEINRGLDHVVALIRVLLTHIAGRIDEVDVVAGAALHDVVAAAAVERVVAGIADQGVGVGAADRIDVAGAVEDHRVDVGADRVV